MDNDTTVEAFKYLNYCQLAKCSRVSKRFWDLIRTHRHQLALLYVIRIEMSKLHTVEIPATIELYKKELPRKKYNKWVNQNQYSRKIPFEEPKKAAREERKQFRGNSYILNAYAYYKDQSQRKYDESTRIFRSCAVLNNESWPVFQHLALLLSDPFAYIRDVDVLAPNIFILMTRAMKLDRNRLHCAQFDFTLENNAKKFLGWIKEHVSCKGIGIYDRCNSNYNDEELLDFFVTGAHCTSEISVTFIHDFSKIVVDLVQKFMDLKNGDEYLFVESILSHVKDGVVKARVVETLKRKYDTFIVKENNVDDNIDYVFEFVNNHIGKKLKLSTTNLLYPYLSLKIQNFSEQSRPNSYALSNACAEPILDPNQHRPEITSVLYTNSLQPNNENWPLLQHFARLLSDPFIHIRCLGLIPQSNVFNLMTRALAMNFDRNRLQCEELYLPLEPNVQNNIGWIKDHVFCEKMDIQMFCEKMEISNDSTSNYDQELNDFTDFTDFIHLN